MSQSSTAVREPLLRIAKREGTTMPQKIAVRAIAMLLALVVDALFIYFVTGLNPLDAARPVHPAVRRHRAGACL